ncbi:MAG: hypothetical protein ACLSHG_10585 [Oscillospiraceae bacterium]
MRSSSAASSTRSTTAARSRCPSSSRASARQAENRHFGKPSGLMDQLACALDGAVYIDFAAGEIAPVAAPFADMGLTLSLTDTGGSHAGLTAA